MATRLANCRVRFESRTSLAVNGMAFRGPNTDSRTAEATINAMIASAVLESVFGPLKAIPFTASDVRDSNRTRQFASLADMAEEKKNVRVWGGVHYRFAIRT